jgi:molecular chaperone DnaJ
VSDYYEMLGIARNATDEEIKRAYRALARQYHPDSNPDPEAEAKFKEINVAYETLKDPERRRRYDVFGEDGGRPGGGGGPAGGEAFGFGDIFDAFFGGDPFGNRQAGPPRAPDAEAVVHLELAQAAFGTTATVDVRLPVACERCDGSGCEPGTHRALRRVRRRG